MSLRFLVLIREMREGGESKIFLSYSRDLGTSLQSFRDQGAVFSARGLFISDETNGGWFFWRCNWIVGSSVNVLTDLILFRYQTAIKYTINFNY